MKNIFVTGSCGYIGSVLVQKLIDQGYFVTGDDNLLFKNSKFYDPNPYPFRKTDIRILTIDDLKSFDAIIHLAAMPNDHYREFNPEWTEEINYKESIRLAKLAKKAGVKRFIFASSCSIYGIASKTVDETSRVHPLTIYAKTKRKSEIALKKIANENFCVALLRNSTVYGFSPAFRDDLPLNRLTSYAFASGKIDVKGNGELWRPLIDVRDLAQVMSEFLKVNEKKINGQVINIGFNDGNYQTKTLAEIIHKNLPKSKIIIKKEKGVDPRSYRVNFDKLHKLIPGLKREWPAEKSIDDMIKNFEKYHYNLRTYSTGKFARNVELGKLLKKQLLTDKLFWKNSAFPK